jgi:RNA polymerase sigma-70 factor (ECF subfamily)
MSIIKKDVRMLTALEVKKPNPDAKLILSLQNGNLEALGGLYDRHRNLVFRTALAITGDAEAAADLLQEVFLRLHRFASHIDAGRPLEPWLYRMTTNLSYTWVKRHNRLLRPLEDVADWITGSRKDTPAIRTEINESWRQVQQAMSSLPLSHRGVIVLYYIDDLPIQEIAEILDIPAGTVKSRLHYSRQALRKSLDVLQNKTLPEMSYECT